MPDPVFPHLDVTLEGPIARLTLNRPEVLNALSVELLDSLVAACTWLQTRSDCRVVILAGAGRSFSAGADLSTMEHLLGDPATARAAADAGDRAASAIEALDAITIARIQGRCVGGGVVLALACDLRVAGDTARFSIPEVDLGIPLAWGGIPRLLREVPAAVARDLVLTCREFGATEAQGLGMLSRVSPDEELTSRVDDLAAELALKARLPVRATLDAVQATLGIGAPLGWSDADSLLSAVRDPESRAVGRGYLERVFRPDEE
ncbi:MAG: enoyl-CoA hydratase/isomerase family protein [Nitriliruptoraceae bacterium]